MGNCCISSKYSKYSDEEDDTNTRSYLKQDSYDPYQSLGYTTVRDNNANATGESKKSVEDSLTQEPIQMMPVKVANVDKKLQDHSNLYNNYLGLWRNLQQTLTELSGMFPEKNTDKTVAGCFQHIKNICGDSESVSVKQEIPYCVQIEYDAKEVNYRAIPAFLAFNKCNKLVKELVDKGPPVVRSVELVVNDERQLRKQVLIASLGEESAMCMRNCINNIKQLEQLPGKMLSIRNEALLLYEGLKTAVDVLAYIQE